MVGTSAGPTFQSCPSGWGTCTAGSLISLTKVPLLFAYDPQYFDVLWLLSKFRRIFLSKLLGLDAPLTHGTDEGMLNEQTELALIAVAAIILALMGLGGLLHYRKRRQGGLLPALIHWSRNMHNMGTKMKILPPESARWYV
jgi:hypothetical protein